MEKYREYLSELNDILLRNEVDLGIEKDLKEGTLERPRLILEQYFEFNKSLAVSDSEKAISVGTGEGNFLYNNLLYKKLQEEYEDTMKGALALLYSEVEDENPLTEEGIYQQRVDAFNAYLAESKELNAQRVPYTQESDDGIVLFKDCKGYSGLSYTVDSIIEGDSLEGTDLSYDEINAENGVGIDENGDIIDYDDSIYTETVEDSDEEDGIPDTDNLFDATEDGLEYESDEDTDDEEVDDFIQYEDSDEESEGTDESIPYGDFDEEEDDTIPFGDFNEEDEEDDSLEYESDDYEGIDESEEDDYNDTLGTDDCEEDSDEGYDDSISYEEEDDSYEDDTIFSEEEDDTLEEEDDSLEDEDEDYEDASLFPEDDEVEDDSFDMEDCDSEEEVDDSIDSEDSGYEEEEDDSILEDFSEEDDTFQEEEEDEDFSLSDEDDDEEEDDSFSVEDEDDDSFPELDEEVSPTPSPIVSPPPIPAEESMVRRAVVKRDSNDSFASFILGISDKVEKGGKALGKRCRDSRTRVRDSK